MRSSQRVSGMCFLGLLLAATAPIWNGSTSLAQESRSSTPTATQGSSDVRTKEGSKHEQDRVSLRVKDSTVRYVIKALAQQSHMQIIADAGNAALSTRITVRVNKLPIMDALALVLKGTGLVARRAPDGETIIVRSADTSLDAAAGSGTIAGRVTDSSSGRGLSGVTIHVQSTARSTVSSDSGRFVLHDVPAGTQILAVKVFGYHMKSQAVTVIDSQTTQIRIPLTPVATVLSGMVTTATGVQRRLEVGSDITTINVDSVMAHAPVTSVTDLLEARVPGLTVVHTTGTPGDPARIRLRGAASITGNNAPIIILDGIRMYYPDGSTNAASNPGSGGQSYPRPSPLDQIDPNTIETIEVFKGPSASALYGSDAANGVIVITTKRGRAGETHWSVALDHGVSYIPGEYPTNSYAFGHNIATNTDGIICSLVLNPLDVCRVDSIVKFQALNVPRITPLTYGFNSSASATVSGGVTSLQYSFTGSVSDNHGMIKMPDLLSDQYTRYVGSKPLSWMRHPDGYKTWDFSSKISAQIFPTLMATASMLQSNSDQRRSSLGLTGISALLGIYIDTTSTVNQLYGGGNFIEHATSNTRSSANNVRFDWQARPWLPINVTGGVNTVDGLDKTYIPAGLPIGVTADSDGTYAVSRATNRVSTVSGGTTLPIPLPRKTHIDLNLGATMTKTSVNNGGLLSGSVPVGVENPTVFDRNDITILESDTSSSTYGWFAEPLLRLPGRLFVTPGFRLDGGSASGSNAGLTALPKISVSWVAYDRTGEGGPASSWPSLSQLRLRGTLGAAGVQPAPGDQLRLYRPMEVSLDGGQTHTQGYSLFTIGNTTLRPERSTELETGFDAEFWNERISLGTTYYRKQRRDAIVPVTVASSVADFTQNVNIGVVRNTGYELSGTMRVLDTRALQWQFDVSASHRTNRVVALNAGQPPIKNATFPGAVSVVPGYPIFGIWSRPLAGYSDNNHDGVIQPSEVILGDSAKFIGGTDPKYDAKFGTNIGFFNNRLTVSSTFLYENGLTQLYGGGAASLVASAADSLASLQQQAVAFVSVGPGYSTETSTLFYLYQTVNTFRWQAVSVNYTLPEGIARRLRGHIASIAIQGSNLFLHSNYRGKDPNVNAFSAGNQVADQGTLPEPRTWSLRVSIIN